MGNNGTPVPEITREQRMAALEKGMRTRTERARVKQMMKAGRIGFGAAARSDAMRRCRVSEAIAAMPGYGKAKAEALMKRLGISPRKRVGGLGKRQMAALLEVLEDVH